MFMDIDRYQITMDGETLFNEEFYKNLFINIYNHTGRGTEKFVETKRYYIPKNQWVGTRIKRFEVKGVPY